MASVTVALTGYFSIATLIAWNDDVSLGTTFDADGIGQTLSQPSLRDSGEVSISIVGTNNRFTPAFEASGRLIFEASDGETLEVMLTGADVTEPYLWTPTNSAEVIAFANHVRGLTDHNATLTLTDDPPGTDHVVDAGDTSFAFAVPQPTVTYTAGVTAATIVDTQITSTPDALSDTYGLDEIIEFTVTYDVAVDVMGTPQFPMNLGQSPSGSPEYADYADGTGTTEITFEWVVAATDEDTNGIFLYGDTDSQNRGDINLNGGTIRNTGTTIDADLTTLNRGTQSGHRVDGSLGGAIDHAVNAGDTSFAFAVPEPTVAHTPRVPDDHAIDAVGASWAFAVPQPTVAHTTPQPTDYAVDAGDASWSLDVPQPVVTHTSIQPQNYVVNAGDAAWAFATSQPTIAHTQPVLVDHTVDAGDISWIVAIPQPTVTYTTPAAMAPPSFAGVVGALGKTPNGLSWGDDGGFSIPNFAATPNVIAIQLPHIDLTATDCVTEISLGALAAGALGGVLYRYSDASNYWTARVDVDSAQLQLRKVVAGSGSIVATAPWTAAPTAEIRSMVQGERHRVWLDGVLLIDYEDSDLATSTEVGMYAEGQVETTFENWYSQGL